MVNVHYRMQRITLLLHYKIIMGKDYKAIRDSKNFWQLDGESDLYAITLPSRPKAGVPTIVRITHSNVYGPFDAVDFFVRIGNPAKPTDQYDLDSAKDWVQ